MKEKEQKENKYLSDTQENVNIKLTEVLRTQAEMKMELNNPVTQLQNAKEAITVLFNASDQTQFFVHGLPTKPHSQP